MWKVYAKIALLVNWAGFPIKVLLVKNSKRVRVLVLAEDSVLLVRSSIGSQGWSLPGGGIEKDEVPADAAVRELKEETNLTLKPDILKDLGEEELPIKGTKSHFNARFFSAELPTIVPVKIIRPFEILEVKWFQLSSLPDNRTNTLNIALNRYQND